MANQSLQELASRPLPAKPQKLDSAGIDQSLNALAGWSHEGDEISKLFRFKDFHETLGFVNAIGWIANRADHHPDLEVGYNRCKVRFSTHSVKGLSENDLVCAARVEMLTQP